MAKQIDKFYRKWNKEQSDMHVLHQQQQERERRIDEGLVVPGAKELSDMGNIKEAACVISYEGMNVFSQIFANSVESAIEKSLPTVVENAIERKVTQIMSGAMEGMRLFAAQMSGPVLHKIEQDVAKRADLYLLEQLKQERENDIPLPVDDETNKKETPTEVAEEETKLANRDPIVSQADDQNQVKIKKKRTPNPFKNVTKEENRIRIQKELGQLIEYLQEKQRPVHNKQMMKELPDIYWGNNPYGKMDSFIKMSDGLIEKAGKGEYQIRQIS